MWMVSVLAKRRTPTNQTTTCHRRTAVQQCNTREGMGGTHRSGLPPTLAILPPTLAIWQQLLLDFEIQAGIRAPRLLAQLTHMLSAAAARATRCSIVMPLIMHLPPLDPA